MSCSFLLLLFSLLSLFGFSIFNQYPGFTAENDQDVTATLDQSLLRLFSTSEPVTNHITATPFHPIPITSTPSSSPTSTTTPIHTSTHIQVPSPTFTPSPKLNFPSTAYIQGLYGQFQTLNLSCESRSAVDFAKFYGVTIGELEFLYALPSSDNPEKGFVGNANGYLGQIPPAPYGVHAAPVAKLLNNYGLHAIAQDGMSQNELKTIVGSGNPVIVWVIYGLGYSPPISYKSSDGNTSTVARYEHTVIVTGYTESTITVFDGDRAYTVAADTFMRSWKVLGNMSVYIKD